MKAVIKLWYVSFQGMDGPFFTKDEALEFDQGKHGGWGTIHEKTRVVDVEPLEKNYDRKSNRK
jgi:hypothetical protein